MQNIFLGADIGGTKTHVLITDQDGHELGFGSSGCGNHEIVGYDGFSQAVSCAVEQALAAAHLKLSDITSAGFGIAGFDWPSQRSELIGRLTRLGFSMPTEVVNDTILGLLAGSQAGWGIAVVSGTHCNCWGWDPSRTHTAHVTGGDWMMGEYAGADELVKRAVQLVSYEWTGRGKPTRLTQLFIAKTGASSLEDLLEGLMTEKYIIDSTHAPLVFQAAYGGDAVALDLIRWAGSELGELAKCVIHQLEIEPFEFDVVQVGSVWSGSPLLEQSMLENIHTIAPKARLVRLTERPVYGAVQLAKQVALASIG
jgi:N-acetylglucosamine kinase-like BadF-type ATPase